MDTFWKNWAIALISALIVGGLVIAFVPLPAWAPVTTPAAGGVALGSEVVVSGVHITPLGLIEDSRCPVDVQCIQAGTVRVRAAVNTLDRDFIFTLGEPQTIGDSIVVLDSVAPSVKHSTALPAASDYRFTFVVEGVPLGTPTGTLSGLMTIGPICPVDKLSQDCKPSAETFSAHKVYVYDSTKTNLITTLSPDAEGKFSADLPTGDYAVDVIHQAIGFVHGVPATVHIVAGAAAALKIDIDTGIR